MDFEKYSNLNYEDFKRLASDENISCFERIGFPDSYRKDKEGLIFSDIVKKAVNLDSVEKLILDIGCGCSELPVILMDHCEKHQHKLYLVDSQEMLDLLPERKNIEKVAGYFPQMDELTGSLKGRVDVIVIYSVLQYVFSEGNLWAFLDACMDLLAEKGQILIGDIPNISKRKRFFSSQAGIEFHKKFMGTDENPDVEFNCIEHGQIDDTVITGIISRARNQGFDAYVLPQPDILPMSNRREDILIIKP